MLAPLPIAGCRQLREDEITGLRKQLAEEKRDRDRLVMDHTNLEKNLADITRSFESQVSNGAV